MYRWSRSTLAALAAAALSTLAACDRESPPTSPVSEVTAPTTSACSFSTLKQAASRYFSNRTQDPIYRVTDQQAAFNLIQSMSQAADPTRTSLGYDLLALLARVANTARAVGTAGDGSTTAYNTLLCTQYASQAGSASTYTASLGPEGLFGVRAGDATGTIDPATEPVVAKRAANAGLTWGLEPALSGLTVIPWSTLTVMTQTPHRILFYSAGTAPTGFQNTVVTGTHTIDVKTVPAGVTFSPYVVVGYCVEAGGRALVEHKKPASEIIPYVEPRFCSGTLHSELGLAPAERTPLALARALVGWGADLLRPAPLRAMYLTRTTGGGKGSVSPFAVVDAGTLLISFSTQPQDATTTTELREFDVRLTSSSTPVTPVVGAPITVNISGNSGSFTLFKNGVVAPGAAVTDTTDDDGIAHFSVAPDTLRINKAGGYTLTARVTPGTSQYSGYPSAAVASTLFHITQ